MCNSILFKVKVRQKLKHLKVNKQNFNQILAALVFCTKNSDKIECHAPDIGLMFVATLEIQPVFLHLDIHLFTNYTLNFNLKVFKLLHLYFMKSNVPVIIYTLKMLLA